MKRLTTIATACVLAASAVLVPQAGAQESNATERTFMTFSSAVELPGVVLEAGTYEFRLADSQARNVVQVYRKDSRDVIGQWTFVAADRPRVSDETMVMFKESKEGTTPAVQFWYYPNEKIGKEFIYPKDQAAKIAARTGQTVRSSDGPVTATASADRPDSSAADRRAAAEASDARPEAADAAADSRESVSASNRPSESSVTRNEAPVSNEPAPQVAAQPAPAPRPVGTSGSASAEAQSAGSAGAQQVARNELPRTASPLPLSGLIGLLSLVSAAGLRAMRR